MENVNIGSGLVNDKNQDTNNNNKGSIIGNQQVKDDH